MAIIEDEYVLKLIEGVDDAILDPIFESRLYVTGVASQLARRAPPFQRVSSSVILELANSSAPLACRPQHRCGINLALKYPQVLQGLVLAYESAHPP